jgi:translocation and assembly module TamA
MNKDAHSSPRRPCLRFFALTGLFALVLPLWAQENRASEVNPEPTTTPLPFVLPTNLPDVLLKQLEKHMPGLLSSLPQSLQEGGDKTALFSQADKARIERALYTWLAVEGYFEPQIELAISDGRLQIALLPGPQAHVASVDLRIKGVLNDDPAYALHRAHVLASWGLTQGRYFTQSDWEAAKKTMVEEASLVHFAAARLTFSQARVAEDRTSVSLEVELDSGPAFFLGDRHTSGLSIYPQKVVDRLTPWPRGQAYRRETLLGMQTRLQDSPYFSAANLYLDTDPEKAHAAPVSLTVSETLPRQVELMGGFSTQAGARIEAHYTDYNIRKQGWQSRTGIALSAHEQRFFSDLWFLPDAQNRQKGVGGVFEQSQIQGLELRAQALGLLQRHERGPIRTEVGVVFRREERQAGLGHKAHQSGLVGHWRFEWRVLDSLLFPRKGHATTLELHGMHRAFLSDSHFLRWHWHHRHYWPLGQQDLIVMRASAGHVLAQNRKTVFESLLFRTGGSSTVRGHPEQGLGVPEDGAIVGGRYMALASVEYQHWHANVPWGGAVFVDAGQAADRMSGFKPAWALGLGVRWKTPLGPLALDVAKKPSGGRAYIHFGIQAVF